ncbi:MAG: hypothetical protein F9K13_13190 [Candidatus Methylomirabilis oxygeniifera]|uniref:DUF4878 domain-containing protein n=1 Tax=Methylomirabilis oxygeniifera TaxID=671143 RepID=D5MJE1_METO1|nr:MAG: hypothetical protein F9K13_13190 [Candidatus Methylomirabilis oxyfera]CBE69528.1 exported protein of unknown function [Candidatus Methylomirabilis oxyfera]
MRLRNVVTGMVVLTFVFLAGCGGGGGEAKGDPIAIAQQFIDLYYKQGNTQEAKALANPEMAEKIQATAAAAAETAGDQEVSYILKEQSREGKHSYALFQMMVKKKDGEPVYKTISLFVDLVDGAWKVTLFDERIEPGPHQETTKG